MSRRPSGISGICRVASSVAQSPIIRRRLRLRTSPPASSRRLLLTRRWQQHLPTGHAGNCQEQHQPGDLADERSVHVVYVTGARFFGVSGSCSARRFTPRSMSRDMTKSAGTITSHPAAVNHHGSVVHRDRKWNRVRRP